MKLNFALPETPSFFMGLMAGNVVPHAYYGSPMVYVDFLLIVVWSWLRFHEEAERDARRTLEVNRAYLMGRYEGMPPVDGERSEG